MSKYYLLLNKKFTFLFGIAIGGLIFTTGIFALENNKINNELEQIRLGDVYAESISADKLSDDVLTTIEYENAEGEVKKAHLVKIKSSGKNSSVNQFEIRLEDNSIVDAYINTREGNFEFSADSGEVRSYIEEQIAMELTSLNLQTGEGDTTEVTEVITIDLSADSVNSTHIINASILGEDISDGEISNSKLANDAVTTDKIQDGTITDADISAGAGISWGKISKTGSSIANLDTRNASDIDIADAGGYFATSNVETVFQEIGNTLSTLGTDYLSPGDNISELINDSGYLTNFTETDPIFTASDAFGIDNTDISNWDTAYSWGDHSLASYLTGVSADSAYLRLNASNDPITGQLNIQVPTATSSALILQTTDDNATKNLLELKTSGDDNLASFTSNGIVTLGSSTQQVGMTMYASSTMQRFTMAGGTGKIKWFTGDGADLVFGTDTNDEMLFFDNSRASVGLSTSAITPRGLFHIKSTSTTNPTLIAQLAPSQTANLTEWQNSSGGVLGSIDYDANLALGIAADDIYRIKTFKEIDEAGNVSAARGLVNHELLISGTGDMSNAVLSSNDFRITRNTGGINATAFNNRIQVQSAGKLNNGTVNGSAFEQNASGDVGSAYLFRAFSAERNGSGEITNLYGLYVHDQTVATNNYALYTNAGNVVFNAGGDANTDFRVAGDTNANLLYTDAGNDRVGLGTSAPNVFLDVNGDIESDLLTASDGLGNLCYNTGGANGGQYLITRCVSSSQRYKEDIQSSTLGLDAVNSLRAVTFEYRDWYSSDDTDIGFIAEEVEKVSPLLVRYNRNGRVENVKYDRITALLVKAMQEQQAQINSLLLTSDLVNAGVIKIDGLEVENQAKIKGGLVLGKNNIGKTTIRIGESEIKIIFSKKYLSAPIVNITPLDFIDGNYRVKNTTTKSFTIELAKPQDSDTNFNWTAFESL